MNAISCNMANNNLWADGKYDCSKWLSNGQIIDDDRFCEEANAAEGSLWFPAAKTEESAHPLSPGPGRHCHLFWEGLVCDRTVEPTPFFIYFAHNPSKARDTGSTAKTIFSVLEESTRWSWSCGMSLTGLSVSAQSTVWRDHLAWVSMKKLSQI